RVEIALRHLGGKVVCPDCGKECSRADLAPERQWRHLDTMQFETILRARVPRVDCPACGVKTAAVPWAGKHSRFTLLFEAFASEVLRACGSLSQACGLLRINWETAHAIMERGVERGLSRRSTEEVKYVGMDEKNFGAGQSYVSIMTDLVQHRVLEVTEERTTEAADQLWKTLPETQRSQVRAVSMDMWQPYQASTKANAPQAEIVHDKFHVSKHLHEAVDKVRRTENKTLQADGDRRLVGTKQLWLFGRATLTPQHRRQLADFRHSDLKTARVWGIKQNFQRFWDYVFTRSAAQFFDDWCGWAVRSRLKPMSQVAQMLKSHLPQLLSYFRHRITNSVSEGFNSKIQSIKANARGFRVFANYRIRILFHCGKLDMNPLKAAH
ncbi:MAG: ISL3 family transposase, partial [Pirellulaceae bacterium]